jgi:ribosome biogenesis GTPase / thiamine phosphate phosphatase
VREDDSKGRHATTSRQLFHIPNGGMIIDTPGIRELQLLDAQEGLEESFTDIEELALRCKFTNCAHKTEPGCKIKNAMSDGTLTPTRWESYLKLQREVAAQQRKREKKGPNVKGKK